MSSSLEAFFWGGAIGNFIFGRVYSSQKNEEIDLKRVNIEHIKLLLKGARKEQQYSKYAPITQKDLDSLEIPGCEPLRPKGQSFKMNR